MPSSLVPYQRRIQSALSTAGVYVTAAQAAFIINQYAETGRNLATFVRRAAQVGSRAYREAQRLAERARYSSGNTRSSLESRGLFLEADNPMRMIQDSSMSSARSSMTANAGYSDAGIQATNPQYVAIVRNQSSSFGKRKRYSKKKMIRKIDRDQFKMVSRFQTFKDNGFQDGLGGRRIHLYKPASNTVAGLFPFVLYDVTSLPSANLLGSDSVIPNRGFQLGYRTTNFALNEISKIGWVPLATESQSAGINIDPLMAQFGVAVTQETYGDIGSAARGFNSTQYKTPHAAGFTHNWSDIRMVLYPQEDLPVKWNIALVSFPDDLTSADDAALNAGPPQCYFNNPATTVIKSNINSTFALERTANGSAHENLSKRWQAFFSGKLLNPINQDSAALNNGNSKDNRLPFKIIKHESFYQPARDNPSFGGVAQRMIKKLFYRRDWEMKPQQTQGGKFVENSDALLNLNTLQTNREDPIAADDDNSSPYAPNSSTVYLAIWVDNYKSAFTGTSTAWSEAEIGNILQAGIASLPSFDLVVKMKHTLDDTNKSVSQAFIPDNPV